MTERLADDAGYSLIELLIVLMILGVVMGGIITVFSSGINAESDQNRRFQAQQDVRVSLDRMRREVHSGCAISTPSTYNTWMSSVTVYVAGVSGCTAGSNPVTWCTSGSGSRYALYRVAAATCTGSLQKFADYLTTTAGKVFVYLPPNSHVGTTGTLGGGTSAISTQDGSSTLPRLHVDLTVNLKPQNSADAYRLADDIAFRNGPRACDAGVASC